jgi:hypothetical protein
MFFKIDFPNPELLCSLSLIKPQVTSHDRTILLCCLVLIFDVCILVVLLEHVVIQDLPELLTQPFPFVVG